MKNKITLTGVLSEPLNVPSKSGEVFYNATMDDGNGNVLPIRYHEIKDNPPQGGEQYSIIGNVRTRKTHNPEAKSGFVETFVFTSFKEPEDISVTNAIDICGMIKKKSQIYRKPQAKNKQMLYFILENSFERNQKKFTNYIPCVVWGSLADDFDRYNIGDYITIQGYLRSRTYHKTVENGKKEERIAYECYVTSFKEATDDERND